MWFGDLVQNVTAASNSREFPSGRNAYYTYIHDSIKSGKAYEYNDRFTDVWKDHGGKWTLIASHFSIPVK